MLRTMEVEIDEKGQVHPVEPGTTLPEGRALLAWPSSEDDVALLLAEPALSDWLRPEEDAAWEYLRQAK